MLFALIRLFAPAAIAAGPASDLQPELRSLLQRQLKFSPGELTDLERGKIVKHTLSTSGPGEIAAVGGVRVRARKEKFLEAYRDISTFKKGPNVVEIGRFSMPPVIEDLAALTITREDVNLRACRVGDCDVRLSADVIGRFRREIDWNRPDADERAAALFRRVLLENTRAYVTGGPGRITEYDDDKRPVRPVEDFAGLLKNSPYIDQVAPGLGEHLATFPSHRLADGEDFLYWSKEKFGLTPFITVTHVTIVRGGPHEYLIATKDVYSSRYFDASLALAIASDSAGDAGAFYLFYVNRSRANALKGSFTKLRRAIVERRAKGALEDNLKSVKRRLEQPQ